MENTTIDYAKFVAQISKPGEEIIASLTPERAELNHMACGLCGETGEVLEHIKKLVHYGKPLPMEKVLEEMGDIEFYLQGLRNLLHVDRETIIRSNYGKLSKRYASGSFSNEQAQSRADKA